MEPVPTNEADYLEEDKPIRGQNYVCLSFVSPEDVIRNKEAFYMEKYLSKFSMDVVTMFDNLLQKYPDSEEIIKAVRENHEHLFKPVELESDFKFFKQMASEKIEQEYLEVNSYRSSVRGIKVRGVFETLKEAQVRAELLRRLGDKFDIFVGQVGVWCPWSPNPEDIKDQQYAETQLNTLVKNYRENMELRDEFYAKRKDEKIAEAQAKLQKSRIVEEEGEGEGAPAPEPENEVLA